MTTPPAGTAAAGHAGPGPGGLPLAMTRAAMNAAYDNGDAVPLGRAVAWLARYRGAWRVVYERGWLRVTETATAGELDEAAARLARAEPAAAAAQSIPDDTRSSGRHAD
jgi:hypothetical protein